MRMKRKDTQLLVENWRNLIGGVISESSMPSKLASIEFDDDSLLDFASSINGLVSSVCDPEEGESIVMPIGCTEEDVDRLRALCASLGEREKINLSGSFMGVYNIKKSVFDALGFTQGDIDKLLSHGGDRNEYESSYDYYGPSVSDLGDELAFNFEY